jgi:hypothetical protein
MMPDRVAEITEMAEDGLLRSESILFYAARDPRTNEVSSSSGTGWTSA